MGHEAWKGARRDGHEAEGAMSHEARKAAKREAYVA